MCIYGSVQDPRWINRGGSPWALSDGAAETAAAAAAALSVAMEGEAKVRGSRSRRRERAARMQKQALRCSQSGDDGEDSPGRSKPSRPPTRKKRNKEPIFEEDVVDGFAILSFKSYEDLEVSRPNISFLRRPARCCQGPNHDA